jgi:hypothetical protein
MQRRRENSCKSADRPRRIHACLHRHIDSGLLALVGAVLIRVFVAEGLLARMYTCARRPPPIPSLWWQPPPICALRRPSHRVLIIDGVLALGADVSSRPSTTPCRSHLCVALRTSAAAWRSATRVAPCSPGRDAGLGASLP